MAPQVVPVETSTDFPAATTVVIIGGGIVGISAALALIERNIPVVVLEKGKIGAEQSSRNLGWIRKTSRLTEDIPMSLAADKLWAEMPERIDDDVGYKQAGIMFIARTEGQMAIHEKWFNSVVDLQLDSRLLSSKEINELVPGNKAKWVGGVYTPSDGRAEPTRATSTIAKAAMAKGVVIIENCAVRNIVQAGGKVSGVDTEKGEIKCEQVLLASGAWTRRFLGNLGIPYYSLPLICSVLRTNPMEGPTDIAVGAPDFSFRKHQDGGFIITQRGAVDASLTLDHFLLGMRYRQQLQGQRDNLRISIGKDFISDLLVAKHWKKGQISPFEKIRINDPPANRKLNEEAMRNLRASWPVFNQAEIAEAWAGIIDVTPDTNPVIGAVPQIPGLTIASGFSGHGFGTSPAAGQLAADLISNTTPIVDPAPYRFGRF